MVCTCMQANDESGLSGSLNLGHYGVTQTNSFESVKVGGQGAELVTPFAKLQVPYQVRPTSSGVSARVYAAALPTSSLLQTSRRQPLSDNHTCLCNTCCMQSVLAQHALSIDPIISAHVIVCLC